MSRSMCSINEFTLETVFILTKLKLVDQNYKFHLTNFIFIKFYCFP